MLTIPVIDIGSDQAFSSQVPVRKLIYLVLLVAIRDRATEVRFSPSEADSQWKLGYEIDGRWHEMVPVPLHWGISQEIRRLAGLRFAFPWRQFLVWRKDKAAPDQSAIRLQISGKCVEIMASLGRAESGSRGPEAVILRLPQTGVSAEEAGATLQKHLRRHRRDSGQKGGQADAGDAAERPTG